MKNRILTIALGLFLVGFTASCNNNRNDKDGSVSNGTTTSEATSYDNTEKSDSGNDNSNTSGNTSGTSGSSSDLNQGSQYTSTGRTQSMSVNRAQKKEEQAQDNDTHLSRKRNGYSAPNGTDAENHDGDYYTKNDTTRMPSGPPIK